MDYVCRIWPTKWSFLWQWWVCKCLDTCSSQLGIQPMVCTFNGSNQKCPKPKTSRKVRGCEVKAQVCLKGNGKQYPMGKFRGSTADTSKKCVRTTCLLWGHSSYIAEKSTFWWDSVWCGLNECSRDCKHVLCVFQRDYSFATGLCLHGWLRRLFCRNLSQAEVGPKLMTVAVVNSLQHKVWKPADFVSGPYSGIRFKQKLTYFWTREAEL